MKDEFVSRHTTDISRYRIECAKEMMGKVLDVGGGLGGLSAIFWEQGCYNNRY